MRLRLLLPLAAATACVHGFNQGKQVANYVMHHVLQPLKH